MYESRTNTKFERPVQLIHTKSLRDLMGDLQKAKVWLFIAATAAFLASAFFVVKYFVGGEMTPEIWTAEQWMNAFLGLGITAVITAAQAFLYASGSKGQAALIATFVVVFFGVFSEISQSMEREDATVKSRSESSPVFQAAVSNITNVTQSMSQISPEQRAYTEAQSYLQYWEQLKEQKNENHRTVKYAHSTLDRNIALFQRKVDALQQQISMQQNNRGELLTGAIQQAKALEYDEDKHYAMIRLIKQSLGVTGIWASFLFSIIIIGTFEYAFHFVGSYVADHKKALLLLGRDANGRRIQPAAKEPSATDHIPRDFGNDLREEYLSWVSPNRQPQATHATPVPNHEPTEQIVPNARNPPKTKGNHAQQAANNVAHKTSSGQSHNVVDMTQERFFKLIYAEVRDRVIHGEVRPTVRPVTDTVTEVIKQQAHLLGMKPSTMGKPQRQKVAETILLNLEQEGVIELNKSGGIGKAKYVLASQYAANEPNQEIPNHKLKQASFS